MDLDAKIYVAGHRGLVGSAIVRELARNGHRNIVTRTHRELDLTDRSAVATFFRAEQPDYVFLAAAKVGGIWANSYYPADFIYENLAIQTNVLEEARRAEVQRLLYLGSSCIYPRDCPQPIRENYLLTGPLEPTNRPYAVAKISGIETCWAYNRQYGTQFIAVMPTNLYGPGDNYDLQTSHVLPALIRRMHEAKQASKDNVVLWGTGTPRREFLHSDDLAAGCVFMANLSDSRFTELLDVDESEPPLINVGSGVDYTIRDLAEIVRSVVGFEGVFSFDTSKPDGTMRKLLDVSKMRALGWRDEIGLQEGLTQAYTDFLQSRWATEAVAS